MRKYKMLRVALCSFLLQNNRLKNLESICIAIKNAAQRRCNLVCFPECALTGLPNEEHKRDLYLALKIPGITTRKIGNLARKHKIHVAIGLLERTDKKIYDSAVLFSDQGKIVLKYRRINPQWHSKNAPKSIYREGVTIKKARTPFGNIAFALYGDIFDNKVIGLIKKQKPDHLIVPISRSFDDGRKDQKRWDKEEEPAYAQQIKKIGIVSFLINAFEHQDRGGAFGGCFVISSEGKIISRTKIGKSVALIWEKNERPSPVIRD